MTKFLKLSIVAMLFVGVSTTITSCYKKKDTVAIITIVNANNDPVNGAEVTLTWADGDRENLEQTATSDGAGRASFNYNELYKSGQAGVFVLDVYVNGTIYGIIRVEQETTSEETIVCTNCP